MKLLITLFILIQTTIETNPPSGFYTYSESCNLVEIKNMFYGSSKLCKEPIISLDDNIIVEIEQIDIYGVRNYIKLFKEGESGLEEVLFKEFGKQEIKLVLGNLVINQGEILDTGELDFFSANEDLDINELLKLLKNESIKCKLKKTN